jgi:hypothetical protein
MDEDPRARLSMLAMLHATCETAVEMFGSKNSDERLVADLKRVLEQTRRELEARTGSD